MPKAEHTRRQSAPGTRGGHARRWIALAALWFTTGEALAAQDPTPSVPLCEQTVHADAGAALAMADGLLAPLDPQRETGAYHEALGCKAWALAQLGRAEAALALAADMAAAASHIEAVDSRVRVLRRAASVHQTLDRFAPAVELLGQALRLAESEGLQGLAIEVMTNLAVLHSTANQFDQAIAHLERALALALATEDRRRELPVRFNLGQTYRSAGRFAQAAETLEPLLPALETPGLESRLASLLATLGWLRAELGDSEAAERYLVRAQLLLEDLDNPAELTVVLNGQARLLLDRGRAAEAEVVAVRAKEAAERAGDHTSLSSALSTAVAVNEALGRHAEALRLLRAQAELGAEHIREQQRSRLNELEVQLGLERQARELDQLRQERERQANALQAQRRNLLLALALVGIGLLALAWQRQVNRRLHRLSRTDQLTGLLNRRGLAEVMEKPRADDASPRLVMLIDIDHFKAINDRHGHATGDRMLTALGAALQDFADQHQAHAARWGGEEFAVLLQASGPEEARRLAAQIGALAARIEAASDEGEPVRTTVSLGFAPLLQTRGNRPGWQQTLRLADELLYRAKGEGRSRGLGIWQRSPTSTLAPDKSLDELLASEAWQLLLAYGAANPED